MGRLGLLLLVLLVVGVAIYVGPRLFAFYSANWGTESLIPLLHDEIGLSRDWSSTLAVALSYGYILAFGFLLSWSFVRILSGRGSPRGIVIGFFCYVFAFTLPPLLRAASDTWGSPPCFSQTDRSSIKWYVRYPGGQILLFSDAGFDKFGNEKQPVTKEVCEQFYRQNGRGPRRISADARDVDFFSPGVGLAQVWYSKDDDGEVELFDGDGFNPRNGQPLRPVTKEIAKQAREMAERRRPRVSAPEAVKARGAWSETCPGTLQTVQLKPGDSQSARPGCQTSWIIVEGDSVLLVGPNGSFLARRGREQDAAGIPMTHWRAVDSPVRIAVSYCPRGTVWSDETGGCK